MNIQKFYEKLRKNIKRGKKRWVILGIDHARG